jgi:SET domain-containing protein
MSKPLWKEAIELKEEYAKHGINYSYNQRNKQVYLSILNAPYTVPNVLDCQLTGYLIVYGGVVASREIEKWIEEVKYNYKMKYENNPLMLEYLKYVS